MNQLNPVSESENLMITATNSATIAIFVEAWNGYIHGDFDSTTSTDLGKLYIAFTELLKLHSSYNSETNLFNGLNEVDWVYELEETPNYRVDEYHTATADPSAIIELVAVQMYDWLNTVTRLNKAEKMLLLSDTICDLQQFYATARKL